MRIFDADEKEVIKKIIEAKGYSRTFVNLFDSRNNLQGTRIEIDKENRKASFLFQIQQQEPSDAEVAGGIEKQRQLTELIIKYVMLFRYLEKEGLLPSEYMILSLFTEAVTCRLEFSGEGTLHPVTRMPDAV